MIFENEETKDVNQEFEKSSFHLKIISNFF